MSDIKKAGNLHSGDEALIRAAQTGEGAVELTPDLLKEIGESLKKRIAEIEETYDSIVQECPYEVRLAVVAWAMKHIVAHAEEGGTFRHLIYDRLGFDMDAYVPLYQAGGMTISNEFNLAKMQEDHGKNAK